MQRVLAFLGAIVATASFVVSASAAEMWRARPGFLARLENPGGLVSRILVAPDGKFYVAGRFSSASTAIGRDLVRFNADGSVDPTFTPDDWNGLHRYPLTVQPDGKLLTIRQIPPPPTGGSTRYRVERLNTEGAPDPTFDQAPEFDDSIYLAVVQTDGRIVIGGRFFQPGEVNLVGLARLLANGAIDPSFSSPLVGSGIPSAVVPLADGGLLVGGDLSVTPGVSRPVLRLHADGTPDDSFVAELPGIPSSVNSLVRQPDGKILVAGYFYAPPLPDRRLVRLNADGSVDASFVPSAITGVTRMEFEPDGRIFVLGSFATEDGQPPRIAGRLLANGALDETFQPPQVAPSAYGLQTATRLSDGRYLFGGDTWLSRHGSDGVRDDTFPTPVRVPGAVAVVASFPDGRFAAAGRFEFADGQAVPGLVRLQASGALDMTYPVAPGFGTSVRDLLALPDGSLVVAGYFAKGLMGFAPNGTAITGFPAGSGTDSEVKVLLRQPDGRILAGGVFTTFDGAPAPGLVRLESNGARDGAFAIGTGFVRSGASGVVSALAVQANGRILAGGDFESFAGVARSNLARLAGTGELDATFDPGSGYREAVSTFHVRADGRILVGGGSMSFPAGVRYGVALLESSGVLNPGFEATPISSYVNSLLPDVSDAVIAGGWIRAGENRNIPFARVSAGGALSPFRLHGEDAAWSATSVDSGFDGGIVVGADGTQGWAPLSRTLAVLEPAPVPVITTPPANQVANPGATVTFTVSASGPDLAYQWLRDGREIGGANSASLTLIDVQLKDVGSYAVRISNVYDTIVSSAAELTGSNPPPTIVTPPAVITATDGESATMQVTISGATQPTYQWRRNGVVIPGATSSTLTFAPTHFSDAAFYDVIAGDGLSAAMSEPGRLIVYPPALPNVFRPVAAWGPRLERAGGLVHAMLTAPDGKLYVAGEFSSVAGATTFRVARFNSDGSVDATFTPAVISDGAVHAMALQTDGRLVLGGTFTLVGGVDCDRIARLNPDGSVDTSLSTGAGFEPAFSLDEPTIKAIAIQSDGRIVVGGDFARYRGEPRRDLLRLNPDGTLDPGFTAAADVSEMVNALAVQSDGRILVGGWFGRYSQEYRNFLVRLETNGARDDSFNSGQYLTNAVDALAVQLDGRILVGGDFYTSQGGVDYPRGITRLNGDGSRDASFAPDSNIASRVKAIVLLPGGEILVGGRMYMETISRWQVIARLTATGATMNSWGESAAYYGPERTVVALGMLGNGSPLACLQSGGFNTYAPVEHEVRGFTATLDADATFRHTPRKLGVVHAIAAGPGQTWAVGGDFAWVDGATRGGLIVLDASGAVAPGFTSGAGCDAAVYSVAWTGDGKIVAGGRFEEYNEQTAQRIVRVMPNGEFDQTFASNTGFGGHTGSIAFSEGGVLALALQSDGRLVAGGDFTSYAGISRKGVVRINPEGSIDLSFDAGSGPYYGEVRAAIVQRDGRVIIGGTWAEWNSIYTHGLMRLATNGAPDLSFNPAGASAPGYSLEFAPDESLWVGSSGQLHRFDASGVRDPSYSPGAEGELNFGWVNALAPDAEGRVIFGGRFLVDRRIVLQRARADGTLDPLFRVEGTPLIRLEPEVHAIAFLPGRKILLGGEDLPFENASRGGLVLLEPAPGPVITAQPVSRVANPGDTVTFAVTATGDGVTYQWYHNGMAIDGADESSLTRTNVQVADAGSYTVRLTNVWEAVLSEPATLTGPNPRPTVTVPPVSIDAIAGRAATLQVIASGAGTLGYQWRKFGTPIAGATSATLTFDPTEFADGGYFDVIVGDGLSVVTSASVEVRVQPPFYPNRLRVNVAFAPRFESRAGTVNALAPAGASQVYVGGSFSRIGTFDRPGLARFNLDGSVDATFDPPLAGSVDALLRQPDGRLLVAGALSITTSGQRRNLVRLLPDGSLDSTFDLPETFNVVPNVLALAPDGKVLVGGSFTRIGPATAGGIVRLQSNGTLDPTFFTGSGFGSSVQEIGVQSDGRVLVAGGFLQYQGQNVARFVRLHPTGELDPSFQSLAGTMYSFHAGLHVLPDDRIIVGNGDGGSGNPTAYLLGRDGAVQLSFASIFTTPGYSTVRDLTVLSDGRIVVLVYTWDSATNMTRMAFARFLATGALDPGFAQTNATGAYLNTVLAMADDSVLVGGSIQDFNGSPANGLIRLQANGAHDPAVNPEFRSLAMPTQILPASDGGWWIGGGFDLVNDVSMAGLVRLTAAGTIAPDFIGESDLRGRVYALVGTPDGGVVAAGLFGGTPLVPADALVRFDAAGVRKESFAPALPENIQVVALARAPDGTMFASTTDAISTPESKRLRRVQLDGAIEDFAPDLTFTNAPRVIFARRDGSVFVDDFKVIHVLPNGTVDPTYATPTVQGSQVSALAELPDGRLLVGGTFQNGPYPGERRNLQRLFADGSQDTGFELTADFGPFVNFIVPHTNGDVLAGGYSFFIGQQTPPKTLQRFNVDGSVDAGFVIEGFSGEGTLAAVHYTASGGLLLAGSPTIAGYEGGGLVLLQPVPELTITQEPEAPPPTTAGGSGVTLTVNALGTGDVTYQWQMQHNGGAIGAQPLGLQATADNGFIDIPGATSATLTIPVPQRFHNGLYRVVVTSNGASVSSTPVAVEVAAATPSPNARLLNLSTRAQALTGDDVIIPGFVVAGTGNKRLLIRAVGPTLGKAPFNLTGVLADPRMRLLKRNPTTQAFEEIAANDNWGTSTNVAAITQTAADVFAFAFNDPLEAALLMDLPAGEYTAIAGGVNNATGLAIVELYDADPGTPTARLINISNRGFAGVGDQVMIPGFVVSSEGPKTLLVRVVGPTLGGFGVPNTMADPKLEVFPTGASTPILSNDNWGDNPDAAYTAQVAAQVLAFALTPGSKDAAFVITLPPGGYTVVGSSAVAGGTGVVLVEVYVVP